MLRTEFNRKSGRDNSGKAVKSNNKSFLDFSANDLLSILVLAMHFREGPPYRIFDQCG